MARKLISQCWKTKPGFEVASVLSICSCKDFISFILEETVSEVIFNDLWGALVSLCKMTQEGRKLKLQLIHQPTHKPEPTGPLLLQNYFGSGVG